MNYTVALEIRSFPGLVARNSALRGFSHFTYLHVPSSTYTKPAFSPSFKENNQITRLVSPGTIVTLKYSL